MKHIKKIKIDIDKKNFEVIPSVQHDSNTRFLHINLLNGAVPFNLTGCSVKISGTKPDGTAIFNNCTVINAKEGFIEVELTEQMNAAPGTVKCELKLYNGKGVLTTKHFDIDVTASVTSKAITSSNEFKALEEALDKVNNIDTKFESLTAETVKAATEKEIQKQIASGHMANLAIAPGSITQDKLSPDIKFGVEDGEVTNEKIANEAITTSKIRSLSLEKIEEFYIAVPKSVNIYDKTTMYEPGHWTDGGSFNSSPDYYNTGYIEVKPLTTYTKSGAERGHPVAFFDKDKRIILPTVRTNTFTTPSNCKYINTLVLAPNTVDTAPYPQNTTRRLFAIVEGNALPEEYPSYQKIMYSSEHILVDGSNLKNHSIQSHHLDPNSSFGALHVGRTIPPETAKLWFIPPVTISNTPPSDIPGITPPGNGQNGGGFIKDSLVIYLDGRYGMLDNEQILNYGSLRGTFGVTRHNNYPNNGVECEELWYNLQPGASIVSQPSTLSPTSLDSEDLTMMIRCKLPPSVISPISTSLSCLSLGSSPSWTGFYFKPLKNNGTRWTVDANPVGGDIASDIEHGDLKGGDIIFIIRKSKGVMDMFLNGIRTKTIPHTHNVVKTWKASTDFCISCEIGKVGSVLIYNRALSDEEIQLNINTEISIRGELSPVIDRNQIINVEGDINV